MCGMGCLVLWLQGSRRRTYNQHNLSFFIMPRRTPISMFIAISLFVPTFIFSQDVIIHPKDTIHEGNYIRVGQSIDVSGTVTKDVMVVGRAITVTGSVGGDVLAVGQTVTIKGHVAGNVRVVGAQVIIEGTVGKNVTLVAQSSTLTKGSRVGWDAFVRGSVAQFHGIVDGSVQVGAETITLAGTITGAFQGSANKQLLIAPTARIGKALTYQSPKPIDVPNGAQVPSPQYQPLQRNQEHKSRQGSLFWSLVSLFGAWIVGLVLLTLFPEWFKKCSTIVRDQPRQVMGWGVVGLLLTPALSIILAITLIGIPLAILLMILYSALLYSSKIIVGYLLGIAVARKIGWSEKPLGIMLGGVLLFVLLLHVRFVGAIVGLTGVVMTLGVVLKLSPLLSQRKEV